jgi:hypothetical protein
VHRAESFLPALGIPLEVPANLSPALAGIIVGAISGIVLFTLVMVVSRRRPVRRHAYGVGAFEVMHVAPYATGSGRVLPPPSSFPPPPPPVVPTEPPRPDDPLARAGQHAVASTGAPPVLAPLAPHPLGVIGSGSTTMRAVRPESLALPPATPIVDDSPTEIAETLFDEPPQPLRRGVAPRIRAVAPSPPRFRVDHP